MSKLTRVQAAEIECVLRSVERAQDHDRNPAQVTCATVVGRFVQVPGEIYRSTAVVAVEVRREPCAVTYHADQTHDHWYIYLVYAERVLPVDGGYSFDSSSSASEIATSHAIFHGLTWDRAAFPHGLVR